MDVSRRRFFGFGAALLAAPAIVKISAIMPVSTMPATLSMTPTQALIASFIETKENYAAGMMNTAAFRELLMPGLREMFDGAYAKYEWLS